MKTESRSGWQKLLLVLGIVLVALFVVIEVVATTGCEAAGGHALIDEDDDGDVVQRSKQREKPPTTTVMLAAGGSLAAPPDMRIIEWLYTEGAYTTLTGFPFADVFGKHGYLAIKVPEPSLACTSSHIVRTGAYSPTAKLYYRDYPTDTEDVIPLEFRDDLVSKVESKYPSGSDAHWEVLWHEADWEWVTPPITFAGPELELIYHFDFCGTPCWGCEFAYLLCLGDVCDGPFPENIYASWGSGVKSLVDFHPAVLQVVSPTVRFTNTNELCNNDTIPRTFDLAYTSSRSWDYTMYVQETDGGPTVPSDTITVSPGWPCGHVYLVGTTTEMDAQDTLHITATSQISSEVYAEAVNLVMASGYEPTPGVILDKNVYLPLVMRSYAASLQSKGSLLGWLRWLIP